MKYCPQCNQTFSYTSICCSTDSSPLIDYDIREYIDQTIDGKYLIKKFLGVGGMGVVFLAHHNEDVALKLLHPNLASDKEFVARFLREIKITSKINHPNAIKIIDFGYTNKQVYYVMEYIEGYTLADLIEQKGRINLEETANIIYQVCLVLENAHKQKIIHRDIKPTNILIQKNTENKQMIKVIDFGIAKAVATGEDSGSSSGGISSLRTSPGTIQGTVAYMSPEQCRCTTIDFRSDIYSLGIVVFQMLTGHHPYDALTAAEMAMHHLMSEPPKFNSFVDDIPKQVELVVERTLNKEPDLRFNSAKEFAEELEKAIGIQRYSILNQTNTPTKPSENQPSKATNYEPRKKTQNNEIIISSTSPYVKRSIAFLLLLLICFLIFIIKRIL
ncbi:MAG: serine/threonine protein kinase [Acidobacteria bacterium]|nr:serine/threonine protein kinase [Acidobacteriota bacterium]